MIYSIIRRAYYFWSFFLSEFNKIIIHLIFLYYLHRFIHGRCLLSYNLLQKMKVKLRFFVKIFVKIFAMIFQYIFQHEVVKFLVWTLKLLSSNRKYVLIVCVRLSDILKTFEISVEIHIYKNFRIELYTSSIHLEQFCVT